MVLGKPVLTHHLDQSVFLFSRESILFSLFFFSCSFQGFQLYFSLASFTEKFIGNLFLFILFGTLNTFMKIFKLFNFGNLIIIISIIPPFHQFFQNYETWYSFSFFYPSYFPSSMKCILLRLNFCDMLCIAQH